MKGAPNERVETRKYLDRIFAPLCIQFEPRLHHVLYPFQKEWNSHGYKRVHIAYERGCIEVRGPTHFKERMKLEITQLLRQLAAENDNKFNRTINLKRGAAKIILGENCKNLEILSKATGATFLFDHTQQKLRIIGRESNVQHAVRQIEDICTQLPEVPVPQDECCSFCHSKPEEEYSLSLCGHIYCKGYNHLFFA